MREIVCPAKSRSITDEGVSKAAGGKAVAGATVRELPFPRLDLTTEASGRAVLKDATSSPVTVAHYYWEFPSREPEAGKPIDPGQRGGVTPARYPVFGADQPVLAAGVFDVSRLYRGLPTGAQKTYDYSKFPGGNDDLGYRDEICTPYHHALTNDKGDAFETKFTVLNIYRLETRQHSYVVHPLFKYSGGPAKIRLTAHTVRVSLDLIAGTTSRLLSALPNGTNLRFVPSGKFLFCRTVPGFMS
jgi:hypothetical protein